MRLRTEPIENTEPESVELWGAALQRHYGDLDQGIAKLFAAEAEQAYGSARAWELSTCMPDFIVGHQQTTYPWSTGKSTESQNLCSLDLAKYFGVAAPSESFHHTLIRNLQNESRFFQVDTSLDSNEVEYTVTALTAAEHDLASLTALYELSNPEDVKEFLLGNPYLKDLLQDLRPNIARYFKESTVDLRVRTLPDSIDDTYLVASVRTHLFPEEAIENFERLNEDWLLSNIIKTKGKLCVTLEFGE
ncbi:hypothetical protein ACFL1X_09915 [Candidatus Hydrogenedentota bacterium]